MVQSEPIPLIRHLEIRQLLDLVASAGAPVTDFLTRSGLPVRMHAQPEGFAPARAILAFAGSAARLIETEDLSWRAITTSHLEELGTWGAAVARCWSLRQALVTFCRAYPRDVPFVQLGLECGDDTAWLWRRRRLSRKDSLGETQGEQFMLGAMVQVVRRAAGSLWSPPAIRIESAASDWVFLARGLNATRVDFGGPALAIAVPYELLDRALPPATRRVTRRRRGRDAAEPAPPANFIESLHQALVPLATQRALTLSLGAEIAETSPRTLRRWLAQHGTTWRAVTDRVRLAACGPMLQDASLSLSDIAGELGYSDQAHFSRAFHRWTGEAPSAYRQRRSA